MTGDAFSYFCMEVSALVNGPFEMLCDNARPHLNAPVMDVGQDVCYLPKYSPFLNATEMAGSCLKAAIKRRLGEPDVQREIYNRDLPRNETLHNRRMRILHREMTESLNEITIEKCRKWYNHTLTYMNRCIRMEDIFD